MFVLQEQEGGGGNPKWSAHKRWKRDWHYDEPKTRGTKHRLNVQNNQGNPFLELEARGFAILQRRHRLMQLLGDEVYGRCTEECACCIMSGRRRPPHSGLLPTPDMSLIQV
jgi:hypothetical protein